MRKAPKDSPSYRGIFLSLVPCCFLQKLFGPSESCDVADSISKTQLFLLFATPHTFSEKGTGNFSLCPMRRRTRINQGLLHPGYTLLWGHKTHPGQPPSPAGGLFLKCPSTRVWLEHDRPRSLMPPPRFPHTPQNRNPDQNLCISKVFP
jgi:hypothetical protein